ncbi:DUF503 domain-containing protein [Okibacterium endophyticum]
MWIGWIEFDILLGDVHSLKEKRSVVRPVIAELRRRYDLSIAEVGNLDVHRRTMIGTAVVSADRHQVVTMLDDIERTVAGRPEIELLSAHRSVRSSSDE